MAKSRTFAEELYSAIGRFVVTWADLEVCLDLLLLKIKLMREATQRQSKLQHQCSKKIALIRSETEALGSSFNAHRAAAGALLDEIGVYADTRHLPVHVPVVVQS